MGDDLSAERTGTGTDVDDVVGRRNRVVIMLDDEHRVAEVAQTFQRGDEAFVVALVQADARLVQNVEHAGQAAADLRGEADALGFAAGEGSALAFEGEVSQADFFEESEAAGDFFDDLGCNGFVLFAELQAPHDFGRACDGEIAQCIDTKLRAVRGEEGDGHNLGPQSRAVATGAGAAVLQGFEALTERFAFGPGEKVIKLREQTVKWFADFLPRGARSELHFQRAIAGAMKKKLAKRRRELAEWNIGADTGVRGQRSI